MKPTLTPVKQCRVCGSSRVLEVAAFDPPLATSTAVVKSAAVLAGVLAKGAPEVRLNQPDASGKNDIAIMSGMG